MRIQQCVFNVLVVFDVRFRLCMFEQNIPNYLAAKTRPCLVLSKQQRIYDVVWRQTTQDATHFTALRQRTGICSTLHEKKSVHTTAVLDAIFTVFRPFIHPLKNGCVFVCFCIFGYCKKNAGESYGRKRPQHVVDINFRKRLTGWPI